MGLEKDIPPGERIVATFRPSIEYLVRQGLSRRTVRKHVDNLWLLGGEIIRDLNDTPKLRRAPVEDLICNVVRQGGPLLYGCDSEGEQRSFEFTCRKLWRFLEPEPP